MSKRRKFVSVMCVSLCLVLLGGAAWLVFSHSNSKNSIPKSISKQLDFEPRTLVTNNESKTSLVPGSYKYDNAAQVLSFEIVKDKIKVIISEQPYPDILIYDKLVNAFNVYSEIDTKTGKVSLGRPKENNGGQAAVVRSDNLLIFGKPDMDLSDAQWKDVFNNLLL